MALVFDCIRHLKTFGANFSRQRRETISMPAPYKRGWKTTGARGAQPNVECGFCGRLVPRLKTFTEFRGFRITDPLLRKTLSRQQISTFEQKVYVCPSCARFRGIVAKRDETGRKFRVPKKRRGF